jgi:hypothetical protein
MAQLVLTDEQRRLFDAGGDVSLVDSQGRLVAIAAPVFTPEEVAEAARHQAQDPYRASTQQVLERIRNQSPKA